MSAMTPYERLAGLCSRSEQCTYDLRLKLMRMKVPSAEAARIIERLKEGGYVDDERFARVFASYKTRILQWGPRKVIAALYAKRIDKELISRAIDALDPGDVSAALASVVRRKSQGLSLDDPKERTKLLRRVVSQGFGVKESVEAIKLLIANR